MMKKIIPYRFVLFYRSLKLLFRKITRKNTQKKSMIPILHIHLTDHCNLNCRACDNFSPLSPEVFADIAVVERDFARISELSNGQVAKIQLLGGEPLMHPKVIDFLDIARKYFPDVEIEMVTNGILLPKQKEDFWEACRRNNIKIIVTKYPIKIDHEALKKLAEKERVQFEFYGSTSSVGKNMQCVPLDLAGKQNAHDSFLRCSSANRCIALDNGKIYTCTTIPYVKYFNTHFGKNLSITEADYMDIYKAKNIAEILEFLSKPMPFCRFCNQKGIILDIGYGVSTKNISEWAEQ